MSWTLAQAATRTFKRNSLATVIVQLRFHPILKIAERIADFQDLIRPRFPGYSTLESQTFEVGPTGMQMRNEASHRFSAASEPTAATLNTSQMNIEYSAHQSRAVLLADLQQLVGALEAVYAPVAPVRLGIRYVNIIKRSRIVSDLQRPVQWGDLLTEEFAKVPGGVATLDDSTEFMVQITAPCTRGKMTARYGLVREQPQIPLPMPILFITAGEQQFRLDTDRYLEGGFETKDVNSLASGFVEDIFRVFTTAAGSALLEWMDKDKDGGA